MYIKKGYGSSTLIHDIRPMKVRIRDDMKVPRALKQHAIHEVEKKEIHENQKITFG